MAMVKRAIEEIMNDALVELFVESVQTYTGWVREDIEEEADEAIITEDILIVRGTIEKLIQRVDEVADKIGLNDGVRGEFPSFLFSMQEEEEIKDYLYRLDS